MLSLFSGHNHTQIFLDSSLFFTKKKITVVECEYLMPFHILFYYKFKICVSVDRKKEKKNAHGNINKKTTKLKEKYT